MKLKSLAALAAFATVALAAQAQSALDLVVGFKSTTATNDVMIDLGQVTNYTAPGSYTIGNYSAILSTTFGAGWSTSSSVLWGAAATFKDIGGNNALSQNYITSKWTTSSGTLGASGNSVVWGSQGTGLNTANTAINKAYTGIGGTASSGGVGYTVGVAETIATSNLSSWKAATTTAASAFSVYTASQFNNTMANIANGGYSVSDLYQIGNTFAGTTTQFVGTFALSQAGDLTFTVIPEPSTYAAILGVATLGFAAIRRRKQSAETLA